MNTGYLQFNDIYTDLITGINGTSLSEPTTAKDFMNNNPLGEWWINKGIDGTLQLCTNVAEGTGLYASVTDANGQNPYNSNAGIFFGGHPPRKPSFNA